MESKTSSQTSFASSSENKEFSYAFYFNNLLPLFDSLSQLSLNLQHLEIIQILMCIIQFFVTSFWFPNCSYWEKTKVGDILHYIAFFTAIKRNPKEMSILFYVFFVIVMLITILFGILIYHYKKTKRINKPILYILRIYYLFFGAAILHPIASLTGEYFRKFYTEADNNAVYYLMFCFVLFFLSEVFFYFNQRFVNESIYLHKSLWATFDSKLLQFILIYNPIILFCSYMFYYYPFWSSYVLIGIHMFSVIFVFIIYVSMSFIVDFANCLTSSIIITSFFIDMLRIVVEFNQNIKQETYVLVSFILFIVITIVIYILSKITRKKINSNLSYSKLNDASIFSEREKPFEPTIEDKFFYFTELKLDKNIKKAKEYLMVGFTSASDLFVDFSFVQFCFENYDNDSSMMIFLMRLLSYFKSENKLLDQVMKRFKSLHDDSYVNNFVFSQVKRIKMIRQVTTTTLPTFKSNELKLQSKNLELQLKKFWSLQTASINILGKMEQQKRYLINLWNEIIDENWASVTFREQHIHFLIESCTDYLSAVKMTSIKDKLDVLIKTRVDSCFLTLIICFPHYVTYKIVDFNGNNLRKNSKQFVNNSSISDQNNKQTYSNESDFSIDEQIATSIMTHGRLRLAIQNALNYVKPATFNVLIIYSIFSILCSFILITITFAVLTNSFNPLDDWNQEVGVLIDLRIAYAKAFLSLSILYGKTTNRFLISDVDCNITIERNRYFLDEETEFNILALEYIEQVRKQFTKLIDVILQISLKNDDISNLYNLLFNPLIKANVCVDNKIVNQLNWSIEQALIFEVFSFATLATDEVDSIKNWFTNNSYWCHDLTTFHDVENKFTEIQDELTNNLAKISKKISNITTLGMIIIAPTNLIIFAIPLPIILFFYTKEINYLIHLMLETDQESKEQARLNISLETINETNEKAPLLQTMSFNWKFFIYCFLIFLSSCLYIFIVEIILYFTKSLSSRSYNYGIWLCEFSLLRSFLTEMLIELINSIYYSANPQDYLNIDEFKSRIYYLLTKFEKISSDVLGYTEETPSLIGQDKIIDSYLADPLCESPEFFTNIHDTYKCGSFIRLISTIHSLVKKVVENIDSYGGIVQGEEISNFYHIIFAHAISSVLGVIDRFSSIQIEEIEKYKNDLLIIYIFGVICVLIWTFSMVFIIVDFKRIFDMALCLIRRLPPSGLINNKDLLNYLLFKKGDEIEMGVTHKIFNNSFDGIICMNLDGVVEIINKSFTSDYGYSTEQLVGQLVGLIFDNDSRIKLENQIKLIKNHESSSYYTEHVTVITNDGRSVPSFITLFAIKGNENSLILVVCDETILLQKKKSLELAKKQSQDLLEQIMPPKVLLMLKEGKSEISFAIPSASIMFVNIVNFSGISSGLSPQQTMGILSTLFGAFDTWIQKYPLMTKIKLIGDSYMAACGLFQNADEHKNHAKQCIDFALRVLNILDDANIKLNIQLKIRIGINSGGPIIAGVLGTENRVFDIIGDPINVASRLEHKSEPGHILMSENTFEMVKNEGFNIIPVGEVFLKGKGNVQAYSI